MDPDVLGTVAAAKRSTAMAAARSMERERAPGKAEEEIAAGTNPNRTRNVKTGEMQSKTGPI